MAGPGRAWLGGGLATLGLAVALVLVLAAPYHISWPDEWAYYWAVQNFARGEWVVEDAQHARQAQETRLQGGRLTQYVPVGDNRWALEKTPGYPMLAVPFQWVGLPELFNVVLAVVTAAVLYFCLGRLLGWRGAWMGVWLFLLTPASLILLYYRYMADFASGALLAIGGAVYFCWRKERERAWLLLPAGLCLGWAVVCRPANLVVAALFGLHFGWVIGREAIHRPITAASPLASFGLGAGIAIAAWLAYNVRVFGAPFDFGYGHSPYQPSLVQGSLFQGTPAERSMAWRVVADNLLGLPRPLLIGFPLLVLALPAMVLMCRRLEKSVALLTAGWAAGVFLSYIPYEWLARLLRMPPNSANQFYVVDRYFLSWLFPLVYLSAATLKRWTSRWVPLAIVAYGLAGGVIFLWALNGG